MKRSLAAKRCVGSLQKYIPVDREFEEEHFTHLTFCSKMSSKRVIKKTVFLVARSGISYFAEILITHDYYLQTCSNTKKIVKHCALD